MTTLELRGVHAGYGRMEILHEVSLRVDAGEIVSLIGANGAGKTTTLRAIAGIVRAPGDEIDFDGHDVANARPDLVVRRGLVHVAQDRELFGDLHGRSTTCVMGGYTPLASGARRGTRWTRCSTLFPVAEGAAHQRADTMSGGQQQMLAIGRALMARPSCLTLDEPSVGLAPKLAQQVLDAIARIRDTGVTVLIVEQNAAQALAISDRAYVIESGSIVLDGPAPSSPTTRGSARPTWGSEPWSSWCTSRSAGRPTGRTEERERDLRRRARGRAARSPAPVRCGGCGGSPVGGPTGACTTSRTPPRCTRR